MKDNLLTYSQDKQRKVSMSHIQVCSAEKGKFQVRYNGMSHGVPLTSAVLANQIATNLKANTYPNATLILATIEEKK
jgi:hypothetical protein